MFKFQAVVTDVETIPEEYRELYEESGDLWVLKMDLIRDHPAIKTVKATADSMDKDKRKLAKTIKDLETKLARIPEDFDPTKYQELQDELETLRDAAEADDPDAKKRNLPSALTALQKKMDAATADAKKNMDAKDVTISHLKSELKRVLIGDGLTKALVEAGVDPKFLKASTALLRDLVSLEEDDGEFSAVVETDAGSVDLSKFISDWAGSDDGKPFILPASGGGADHGGGGAVDCLSLFRAAGAGEIVRRRAAERMYGRTAAGAA